MNRGMGLLLAVAALAASGCQTARPRSELVKAPPRCVDQTVQIYFEPDSAEVTQEGRLVISQAAANARGCRVSSVEVLGLADAVGAPGANFELSKRRADAVASVLSANGLPAADYKLAAAGQAGAVATDGTARPLRRRADITLHLSGPR